jgi:hypothetical protein
VDPLRSTAKLKYAVARTAVFPGVLIASFALATLCTPAVFAQTAVSAKAAADDPAKVLVKDAMGLVRYRKYGDALSKLDEAQKLCLAEGCDAAVRAGIYVAQATIFALTRKASESQERFEWALAEDADVKPDQRFVTRRVRAAFRAAKAKVARGKGATPPSPPEPAQKGPTAEQLAAVDKARTKLATGDWQGCLETMIVATAVGDYAEGKLMLARCQDKGGLLLEAKRDAEAARELAKADGNSALEAEIGGYLKEVETATPKILVLNVKKVGVRDARVKIDGKDVSEEDAAKPIPHNPGLANIQILGMRGGTAFDFAKDVKFQRKETLRFDLTKFELSSPFQQCMTGARTAREERACKAKFGILEKGLNFKAGLEVSSYNDNDNVDIFSPAVYLAAVQPTKGWNIGASAIVDVVTTASADIVSTASRRFDEVRVGGTAGAGYKIGLATVGVSGAFSVEPDYIGRGVGGSLRADLFDKMVSPIVSYSYGRDIIGRADTPFEIFSREVRRHTANAGGSVIFSASTLAALIGTFQYENGDSSKPYRHVPMFDPEVVQTDEIPLGAAPALVAAARLEAYPLEQLPIKRYRYAALLRGIHRFDLGATLRVSERLYMDSWGQRASTSSLRLFVDLSDSFRIGPHARFHLQGPVEFWRRAYRAPRNALGTYDIPKYRTTDRELGPLWAVSAGSSLRFQLSEVFSASVYAEGIYTRFKDHLYLYDRIGLFTASTVEMEIE